MFTRVLTCPPASPSDPQGPRGWAVSCSWACPCCRHRNSAQTHQSGPWEGASALHCGKPGGHHGWDRCQKSFTEEVALLPWRAEGWVVGWVSQPPEESGIWFYGEWALPPAHRGHTDAYLRKDCAHPSSARSLGRFQAHGPSFLGRHPFYMKGLWQRRKT